MIIGIGTDILKIDRIEAIFKKYGTRLTDRLLHNKEKAKLEQIAENKMASFLAKRFAAKEAISKALGTGIGKVGFKDIIILNNTQGKPYAEIDFQKFGMPICKIDLSLSDDYPVAVAFAVVSIYK